jgi:hypothetical protein
MKHEAKVLPFPRLSSAVVTKGLPPVGRVVEGLSVQETAKNYVGALISAYRKRNISSEFFEREIYSVIDDLCTLKLKLP